MSPIGVCMEGRMYILQNISGFKQFSLENQGNQEMSFVRIGVNILNTYSPP